MSKSKGRRGYQRVVADAGRRRLAACATRRAGSGVRLAGGQGSHVLSALAAADALAVIPEPLETVEAGHRGGAPLARPRLTRRRTRASTPG